MYAIMIVEDEELIRQGLTSLVDYEQFGMTVINQAENGREAWEKFQEQPADILLTDINMPQMNGLDLAHLVKEQSPSCHIIFLTGYDDFEFARKAIKLGADDYLPKPFHLAELNARIKSVIRRNQHDGEIDIRQGNVRIEPDKYRVFVNNQELELNRKEYDILLYFINRPGHLVNKNTLAESVWGDHIDQVDNFDFIYAQIKNLRKKLKDAGADLEIKAVYGFGYKMIVEEQKQ